MPIKRKISPVTGVFAVTARLNDKLYRGVCNVGKRPTIGGQKTLLEVFLFDFKQTVYGHLVTIIFQQKIRDEKKFNALSELQLQISSDIRFAEAYFSTRQASSESSLLP